MLLLFAAVALAVIPQPQSISYPGGAVAICDATLSVTGQGGDILQQGIARFRSLVFGQPDSPPPTSCPDVLSVSIVLASQSETLDSNTAENYTLSISQTQGSITAPTVFGALHALETLAQLVNRSAGSRWTVPLISVTDFPRFSFRGFLHDTARHFLPLSTLYQLIDAMAAAKLNVFHWHIVDDQSFPFVSSSLPKLSMGSFGGKTSLTYSPADVQAVIKYAKYRGVRVIPEFDTPGHTKSWGAGYPEAVTPCYSDGVPNGNIGPLNPTLNSTFDILTEVIDAVCIFAEKLTLFFFTLALGRGRECVSRRLCASGRRRGGV